MNRNTELSRILTIVKEQVSSLQVDSRFNDIEFGTFSLKHAKTEIEVNVPLKLIAETGIAYGSFSVLITDFEGLQQVNCSLSTDDGSSVLFNKDEIESQIGYELESLMV